ncbi:MAG: hypothetical protein Q8O67_06780 [Deltaproteobacteria bacterium]|nr:hypothetical protein [Deltaproteobacteria bacterium]
MRKISPIIEVRDRTTLLPGEVPILPAPQLGLVVDCLFALRENPGDRSAKIRLALLCRQGDAACPSCGDEVELAGFRRTRTSYAIRDEWSCSGCDQRFLLCEENVC